MPTIHVVNKETGEIVSTRQVPATMPREEIEAAMKERVDPETQTWYFAHDGEPVEIGNDEVSDGVQAVLDAEAKKAKKAAKKTESIEDKKLPLA